MAVFVELYNEDINLNNIPYLNLSIDNLTINDKVQIYRYIRDFYPKDSPRWANANLTNHKIDIEIGMHFNIQD